MLVMDLKHDTVNVILYYVTRGAPNQDRTTNCIAQPSVLVTDTQSCREHKLQTAESTLQYYYKLS